MVLGRKEVAVDFITKLKDKGFKDLDKNTKKSIKSLQKFGKVLGATLSITAFVAFVKASTKQFAELEANTRRLESELNNLGIAFATTLGTDFTRNLALASGVSQDKLIPALQKLVQTTYTLTDAQKLLSLSTEISKRKGLELEQVSNALSRAFVGDYKSLVRLRIGFEQAELEGKKFEEVLSLLQSEFGVKQADTFADKIAKLSVAFEQTQEAIGKGFVKGLEESGLSIEETQTKMIELGEKIGKALGKAAAAVLNLEQTLENLSKNRAVLLLFDSLDRLFGINYGDLGRAADAETAARVRAAEAYAKQLDTQGKLVKLAASEALLAKQRAADLAKLKRQELARAAEKKRSAEIERLRNAITFKFDIDAINQQAALRRNLSASDRDRVLQLSALKISDYQTDEEAIKTLQAATQGRYDDAMNLEKMLQLLTAAGFATSKAAIDALAALKPEINFKDNLQSVIDKLRALIEGKYTINIGATITIPNIPAPGGSTTTRPGPGDFRKKDEDTSKDIPVTPSPAPVVKDPFIDLPGEVGGEPAMGLKDIFAPNTAAFRYFEENTSSRLRNLFEGGAVPSNFDPALFRQYENTGFTGRGMATPSFFDPAAMRARNEGVIVNVNVQGSVLAQNDLVAAVTDAVYATQRVGNSILLTDQ